MGRSWLMALLAASVGAGCGFDASASAPAPGPEPGARIDAAPDVDAPAPAGPVTVRVEALIDGRSQLRMAGATVQWFHLEFAAPGRHDDAQLPTLIDGIAWFPTWPDDPDSENRDCECVSDVGAVFDPPLPRVPSLATITPVEVRRAASVVEQASAANEFTTVIELDDTGEAGAETYVVDVLIAPE